MAEAPVPDRPNIHSNAPHGLRSLVHADVLIQKMRGKAPKKRPQRRGELGPTEVCQMGVVCTEN